MTEIIDAHGMVPPQPGMPGGPGPRRAGGPPPHPHHPRPATRPVRSGPGAQWWSAKTVLVTRVAGPGKLVTAARLVVPIGDRQLAFRISSLAPEAAQLAQDGRVLVQPGDWHGSPVVGTHQRQGWAQLVTRGTLIDHVDTAMSAKYGWRLSLARFGHHLARGAARYGDVVVLVNVNEPSPIPLPPSAR
ncbi:hypothetical protein NDR87_32450 [Nocardia sp. CDC159]|uniref:Uncharacterized protein n=1 Tax=Nocardia pulmonis TaxID=2951408 RepID=A0A9X2ED02_9NOCA|nr:MULTISPECIES: hypothetical protein [Nocardia]MCM6778204.1 hypothetical protein [Nocardia pulmonis]MCM6791093.1 hypothetical protein [Nocardia sp. CDC159]